MIEIINLVVGGMILLLFIIGIFCNYVVKKKYTKMFSTMENKGRDKNLLIIEREYRHAYLKERVERIKVFVEMQYYEIKLCNIPLYAFEDFTISAVYFVGLLGLIFTIILLAIPSQLNHVPMYQLFFLCIEGLVCGFILMIIRTLLSVPTLRDIFKVNLCSYLEHELELFDEAERDEEGNLFPKKIQEKEEDHTKDPEDPIGSVERGSDGLLHLSDHRQAQAKDIKNDFDEKALLQVLEDLLG